jgi:hypothetical protein
MSGGGGGIPSSYLGKRARFWIERNMLGTFGSMAFGGSARCEKAKTVLEG